MFESSGVLRYSIGNTGHKLVMDVDQDIADYYRKLIPKYVWTSRQRYGAHVSVVRKETPVNLDRWGAYEGEEVKFFYENTIRFGQVYCWLNVFCKRLEEIRLELGLPVDSPYTLPPEGFFKCYHMTIGNFKGK